MYHLLQQSATLHFVLYFVCLLLQSAIISLNSINKLIFVMVKCCVFIAVRTEFLNVLLRRPWLQRFKRCLFAEHGYVRWCPQNTVNIGFYATIRKKNVTSGKYDVSITLWFVLLNKL
jgi:hypothetical protein